MTEEERARFIKQLSRLCSDMGLWAEADIPYSIAASWIGQSEPYLHELSHVVTSPLRPYHDWKGTDTTSYFLSHLPTTIANRYEILAWIVEAQFLQNVCNLDDVTEDEVLTCCWTAMSRYRQHRNGPPPKPKTKGAMTRLFRRYQAHEQGFWICRAVDHMQQLIHLGHWADPVHKYHSLMPNVWH